MKITNGIECLNGQLKRVETVTYSNGDVVKRIYDRINDVMASDLIVVKADAPVGKVPVHPITGLDVTVYRKSTDC